MSDTLDVVVVFERKPLLKQLMEGVLSVSFTKLDGTARTLICTLQGDRIPEDKRPGAKSMIESLTGPVHEAKSRKKNFEVIPVWSLADESWRSFRVDSVKEVRNVSDEDLGRIIPDPTTPVNVMRRGLGLPLLKG